MERYPKTEAEVIVLDPDEKPKSGEWIDACDVVQHPLPEEIEAGNVMGELDSEDDPYDDVDDSDE